MQEAIIVAIASAVTAILVKLADHFLGRKNEEQTYEATIRQELAARLESTTIRMDAIDGRNDELIRENATLSSKIVVLEAKIASLTDSMHVVMAAKKKQDVLIEEMHTELVKLREENKFLWTVLHKHEIDVYEDIEAFQREIEKKSKK